MPWFHPLSLMSANKAVFGVNLGHLWEEGAKVRAWGDTQLTGVTEGWIRPHADRTFPLDDAGEADAYIEARRNKGKVVLEARSARPKRQRRTLASVMPDTGAWPPATRAFFLR